MVQAKHKLENTPGLNVKDDFDLRNDGVSAFGLELKDMLAPVDPAVFMSQYWGRKSLFVKGSSDKLQKLIGGFDREDFFRAVREGAAKRTKGFRLCANKGKILQPNENKQSWISEHIQPDQMEEMFSSGLNISAEQIIDRNVAAFASAIKTQMNHLGGICLSASLSPKGNGWPPHFDKSSVVFIQCEGAKRFLVSSEPVAQLPRVNMMFSSDGAMIDCSQDLETWEEVERIDTESLIEVVLEPGDILILPAGTIHGTEALSDSTLTIGLLFEHINFLTIIGNILERSLISNPDWRRLPLICATSENRGELPVEAAQFFAARLAELREALEALSPESADLNREWHRLIADPGEATSASLTINLDDSNRRPVQRKDELQLSPSGPITYASIPEEGSFILFFANKEISVEGEWEPFLKTMIEKRRFVAEDAIGWAGTGKKYPWKIVCEYLEALLEQNILERIET